MTGKYSLPLFQLNRSPLFYVGDKFKLVEEIRSHFPHTVDRFIEPFAGGGSVSLNVRANEYLLNDIDSNVVRIHRFLMDHASYRERFFSEMQKIIIKYGLSRSYVEDVVPYDLKRKWKKTYFAKFNQVGFLRLRRDFNNSDKSNLYELYALLIYGFNRMLRFNARGEYNLPVGNVDFNSNVVKALNDYFNYVADKRIVWFNLDYVEFLNSFEISKDDFVYLDPPYLITSSEYNKLWDENKEIELVRNLDILNARGIRFAVSNVVHYKGKENSIFNQWAQQYSIRPIKSNYISYHDNTIKKVREVLVTNYG